MEIADHVSANMLATAWHLVFIKHSGVLYGNYWKICCRP